MKAGGVRPIGRKKQLSVPSSQFPVKAKTDDESEFMKAERERNLAAYKKAKGAYISLNDVASRVLGSKELGVGSLESGDKARGMRDDGRGTTEDQSDLRYARYDKLIELIRANLRPGEMVTSCQMYEYKGKERLLVGVEYGKRSLIFDFTDSDVIFTGTLDVDDTLPASENRLIPTPDKVYPAGLKDVIDELYKGTDKPNWEATSYGIDGKVVWAIFGGLGIAEYEYADGKFTKFSGEDAIFTQAAEEAGMTKPYSLKSFRIGNDELWLLMGDGVAGFVRPVDGRPSAIPPSPQDARTFDPAKDGPWFGFYLLEAILPIGIIAEGLLCCIHPVLGGAVIALAACAFAGACVAGMAARGQEKTPPAASSSIVDRRSSFVKEQNPENDNKIASASAKVLSPLASVDTSSVASLPPRNDEATPRSRVGDSPTKPEAQKSEIASSANTESIMPPRNDGLKPTIYERLLPSSMKYSADTTKAPEAIVADKGAKIVLSEELFDPDRRDWLRTTFQSNEHIQVLTAREAHNIAINTKNQANKVIVVLTDEEFGRTDIWTAGDKATRIHSSMLLLKSKLGGADYLYLEAVLKLAGAILSGKKDAVASLYKVITGFDISADALTALGANPLSFAINAILSFDHLGIKDADELEHARNMMEVYLAAA